MAGNENRFNETAKLMKILMPLESCIQPSDHKIGKQSAVEAFLSKSLQAYKPLRGGRTPVFTKLEEEPLSSVKCPLYNEHDVYNMEHTWLASSGQMRLLPPSG